MIKTLTSKELSSTRICSEMFFRESQVDGVFNFNDYCERMGRLIDLDVGIELAYINSNNEVTGIIGGSVTPCLFTGDIIAVEQFWYVLPEHRGGTAGLSLLRGFEVVASSHGARRVYFGNLWKLNNEKMMRLYSRLGYEPLETHFVKRL